MNIYLTTAALLVCFLALGGLGDELAMVDLCGRNINDETLEMNLINLSADTNAIDMCNNTLKSFNPNLFIKFPNLDELKFDENPELGFPPDGSPFLIVKSLTTLTCNKCGIEKIFTRSLQDLPKIERINLTNNKTTEIERSAFRENRELNVIDLHYNLLERLPNDLIVNLWKIEKMHLSFNRNLSVEADQPFLISNSLKHLKCEGCGFTVIYEQTFAKLVDLQALDLKGNFIVEVQSNAFKPLINLTQLFLQSNNISSVYDELLFNEKFQLCLDNNTDKLSCSLQDSWPRFECQNNTKTEVDCNQFTEPPAEPTTVETEISVFAADPSTTITVTTTTTTVTTTTTEVTTMPAVPKASPEPMGISDWYISSYLTIIILTQIGGLVILTGVWLKMKKYDSDPEVDSLAENILNPSSIYRPLY